MKNRKRKHADGRKLEKNKSEITEAVEKTKHKIESVTGKEKLARGKKTNLKDVALEKTEKVVPLKKKTENKKNAKPPWIRK